ncbi:hypothetical protein E3N88_45827 [Mikania micrantha]|uniref:Reverse transcriptase domain-containing protein n=1 Tax=Mikania micrantha TaxID=192012 RepID=A0A5N6L806_9ASTR|nr:hypothetical protein E3N88_45827 [Mikania micrantha]
MNDLFRPHLRRFVLVFFDDILVYSPNQLLHQQHLQTALQLLQEQSFYVKLSKCYFGQSQVPFLGHVITVAGVQVDQDKISAIVSWPIPVNVKDVPLAAFETLKQALISAPVLRLLDFIMPFIVECDASYEGVGAILIQEDHPVAYYSKAFCTFHAF